MAANDFPPPRGPAQVTPAQVPGMSGLLGLAVGVVVIAGLYFAQDVLVPITLAIILSFVLSPVVAGLRRLRVPRPPAVLLAVLFALGLLGGLATLVGSQAASLASDAPAYARTINAKIDSARAFATREMAFVIPARDRASATAPRSSVAQAAGQGQREPVTVQMAEQPPSPLVIIGRVLHPVLAPFETFVIVLVVAIFILLQKDDLRDRLIRLFGSSDLHRTTLALDDAGTRLSRYFLSQLAVNATFGTVIGVGLWLIGLPVPALWGILAGILRFVPYIGALLGAALPLVVAAGASPDWSMVIAVVALFAVVEPLTGYAVEPLLYGHSTGLSPLSVVIAAVFWTWIWGPVGLVLSMPLTLCLVVLGRHIPSLEFLDVLLGDRPALTPVEGFYQRMLANDPEEALDQAEQLLTDRTLTTYYDEVALGGLKLAAEDARRGAIDRVRAARMVEAMLTLVRDLSDHDDVAAPALAAAPGRRFNPMPIGAEPVAEVAEGPPAPMAQAPAGWSTAGSVLCIAGRGVLDDAVTAMLEQLLERRGFGVRRVTHAQAGRDAIDGLDLSNVRLICLSYLEIGGTPGHLRYLVRRLKRATGVPVMVGLWPQGEAAMTDRQIQSELGADRYVGSLGEAVEESLSVAGAVPGASAAVA